MLKLIVQLFANMQLIAIFVQVIHANITKVKRLANNEKPLLHKTISRRSETETEFYLMTA